MGSPEPPLSHPTLGGSRQQQGERPSVFVRHPGWKEVKGKEKKRIL